MPRVFAGSSFGRSLLLLAVLATPSFGAGVSADVEQFFPIAAGGRGGGVSPMGKTTFTVTDITQPTGTIHVAGTKDPIAGAWWFPNHLPMTPKQALVGDASGRVVLQISAKTPTSTAVQVQWRLPNSQAGGPVKSELVQLKPGTPTTVSVPVPPAAADAKITGLILTFTKPGDYTVHRIALARESAVSLDVSQSGTPKQAGDISVSGEAAANVSAVTVRFTPDVRGEGTAVEKTASVSGGKFTLSLKPTDLEQGVAYRVTAEPKGRTAEASPAKRLFVFPAFSGKQNPPVTRQGRDLMADGKRFGFVGFNYTRMGLGLSVEADYELLAHDVMQMKRWGTRVVRMTVDMGLTQPEPGVFPDSPRYAELMKKHNLDPRYFDQVDYFIKLAGEQGIYTVLDWHGMPIDPYRYFLGGQPSKRDSGEPGAAIAYLAESPTKAGEFKPMDPKHQAIMLSCHQWIAAHYKGDPNVLGIEVPYNEPHTTEMAVEANWRHITDLCAKAVAAGDPDRLTFTMGPSYSHNNLLPSVTWLPPDRAAGAAPHFYQANGPVPVRPDAKDTQSPWLARDLKATFGWSFPAVVLPLSAVEYPFYNGESGMYGHETLLNHTDNREAARILMEAQLVQEYATGMAGHLEWTLWGNEIDFLPYTDIYEQQLKRFAPVYNAGPLDRSAAQVVFVQNNEAVPSANGHNFACTPFAKAALDLHLSPVHYMTDDQFKYKVSAEVSLGLEQVTEAAGAVNYKAVIADRRQLDQKVAAMLKSMKVPVLMLDKADDLTADKLAAFLKTANVPVDQKTPAELQLAEGPEHLIVYRRLDGGKNPTKAYPVLKRTGRVTLTDESGKTVFDGDVAALATQGISVDLPLWRSAIYKIASR